MPSPTEIRETHLHDIAAIDRVLARRILNALGKERDELLWHTAVATSEALRDGHGCLLPSAWAEQTHWRDEASGKPGYRFPPLDDWLAHLRALPLAPDDGQPLVLELNRVYLRRYWRFENELAAMLRQRMGAPTDIDLDAARQVLDSLFGNAGASAHVHQREAIANALGQPFSIITGGPGTGKTFTVTQLLAALQQLHAGQLHIVMAAPTGKAAQRLSESVSQAKAGLRGIPPDVLDGIPETASTLHRLLGVIPGRNDFRHDRRNPLRLDVLLLDEASMIDLPLMTRLLRAVPEEARVILLGDANQLPSVAVGNVLAELVAPIAPEHPASSETNRQRLMRLTDGRPPDSRTPDCVTTLTHSYRFSGGIGRLAEATLAGKAGESWRLLQQGDEQISRVDTPSTEHWLIELAREHYLPVAKATNIDDAFQRLADFRILVATRQGPRGVEAINQRLEHWLRGRIGVPPGKRHFHGQAIMVVENHPATGLYNGDIGLLWEREPGRLLAAFPKDAGSIRWITPARLPAIENVYAMTIHKTQGSEYRQVALLLPRRENRILTRELLYTGITRAREKLSVHGDETIWRASVRRRVERYSGLGVRLFEK